MPQPLQAWAQTQRCKLYRTGMFYDMDKDPMEETPLTDFSPEAKEVRERLQKASDQYKNTRLADLPQP